MVNPKGWHVKKESEAKMSRRWFTRPPIILFIAAILIVIVAGALVTQPINTGFTFFVSNPSLQLSTNSLQFGTVSTDGTYTQPSFTITNTGNVALTLTYSYGGPSWPPWATIHLSTISYGGPDLNGVPLAEGSVLIVYPSLVISQSTGPAAVFSTIINLDGS